LDLAQRKDGPLPIDGILMHGRTYRDAGKRDDAQRTSIGWSRNITVMATPSGSWTA
jgi:hypothetical protein